MKGALAFLFLLSLGMAAPAQAGPGLKDSMAEIGNAAPKTSSFVHCHGRNCRIRKKIGFTDSEWAQIKALFPASSAARERRNIGRAIGLMEKYAGKKTGTSGDVGGTFEEAFGKGQMDCEDETLNTGLYLTLLERKNLLRFHRVAGRAHRGFFFNGWPHRAVKIEDNKTKKIYIVDSWFHDNGKPAEVLGIDKWSTGWYPSRGAPNNREDWLR